MSFKRAKVVMLSTKEKADIYECPNFKTPTLVSRDAAITQGEGKYIGIHLYILSDDEIEDGDWKYNEKLNCVTQHLRNNKNLTNNLLKAATWCKK